MVTFEVKRNLLRQYGYFVGKRDKNVNYNHDGKFMVTESGIFKPCADADEADGFAIVGDNLDQLVDEAYQFLLEQ